MTLDNRPTMLAVLTEMVTSIAKRSTCSRLNVGALVYDDRGVILSGGYNGALAGMPHCIHPCDCSPDGVWLDGALDRLEHEPHCTSQKSCEVSMHAEANAILWAARRGVAMEGHNIITTHTPCYRCAQLIIQSGIKAVRYMAVHRDMAGVALMLDAGVTVTPVV